MKFNERIYLYTNILCNCIDTRLSHGFVIAARPTNIRNKKITRNTLIPLKKQLKVIQKHTHVDGSICDHNVTVHRKVYNTKSRFDKTEREKRGKVQKLS